MLLREKELETVAYGKEVLKSQEEFKQKGRKPVHLKWLFSEFKRDVKGGLRLLVFLRKDNPLGLKDIMSLPASNI